MKYFLMAMGAACCVLLAVNAFAEQIPNENTACYKSCEKARMNCRAQCPAINHKTASKSEKAKAYGCLNQCDTPFNDKCVPACPTKENT